MANGPLMRFASDLNNLYGHFSEFDILELVKEKYEGKHNNPAPAMILKMDLAKIRNFLDGSDEEKATALIWEASRLLKTSDAKLSKELESIAAAFLIGRSFHGN